jgi:replicative DNA helicase Mcm
MNTTSSHNTNNFDSDNNELSSETLKSLHRLGFKLVALTDNGWPSRRWTPIYDNIDYWRESDFTNLSTISKFKNVASTAGKTHLKDSNGNNLFLNVLDIDSENVSNVLNKSIHELIALYNSAGLKIKEFIDCINLQSKDEEQIIKKSLLEILKKFTYVTKTRKPYGFHIWWLSHIQNKSILSKYCKKGFEFEIKADKRGTLCTLPPSTHREDITFRYIAVGNTNSLLVNDALYDLFLELLSECLLPNSISKINNVQENPYFESNQDVKDYKEKISKNLIFHSLSDKTVKITIDYLSSYYEEGDRNNFALPFAGTAFHSNLSEETAISIMAGICEKTNDIDEKKSRINTIQTTYKKGINGIEITGGPTLAELIVKLKDCDYTFALKIVSNLKELWHLDILKGNNLENGESQQSPKEVSLAHAKRSQSGFVKVNGTIISITPVYQMIKSVTLDCTDCEFTKLINYPKPIFKFPYKDTSKCPISSRNSEHSSDNTVIASYEYVPVIDLELQDLDTYNEIERLSVKIFGNETNDVVAGEKVTITGNLHVIRKNDNPNNKTETVLFAQSMEGGNRQEIVLSENDIETLRKWKSEKENQDKNPIDELVNLFAPDLIDLDRVKKGMLLVAASAGLRNIDTRFPKRIRLNALLIGNPGLAKTQVLQKTVKLIPNSQYAGGQSSTGLSLTSQISKEDGGSYTLRFGPVVLAKDSVCAINELGQFPMEQQKHLLDCMEENGFPMAKYGFSTTIEAHPSIIASANPINSRWQNSGVVSLNEFPILPQIIQRFDLIFIFKENNQENYLRSYAERKNAISQDFVNGKYEGNEDFLQKYLYYCKRLKPVINQEAQKKINDYYIEMGKVGISGLPRRLDSLMRITISIAKLKLKLIADVYDAQEAITFYNEGLDDFNQAVKLSDNPGDIAYQEIRKIIKLHNGVPISLIEAAEKACESNENIRHYLLKKDNSQDDNNNVVNNKTKLKLSNSHHLKVVMDLLRKDDCIQIINEKPIELRWKGNRNDGASLKDDDYGKEATENVQESFDSGQYDVCDVYDEDQKKKEKIDKDSHAVALSIDKEKNGNNPNIPILSYDSNIINLPHRDDNATTTTTNLEQMISESKEDRSTSEEVINESDGGNTNNRFLERGHGPNSNKISQTSYTSYTSYSRKDDGAIGKNESEFKSNKEINTEIENSGSVQPMEFTGPLLYSSNSSTPQIKLKHSPKAEIFTNEIDITTNNYYNLKKCDSDKQTSTDANPKSQGPSSQT